MRALIKRFATPPLHKSALPAIETPKSLRLGDRLTVGPQTLTLIV